MSIRVLGGAAKGLELASPKSLSIRPTSVMLKRRLFDSIQNFHNKVFIDLCAGTGSIGIEALSRGAEFVKCIDNNSLSINLLKQNKQKLKKYDLSSRFEVVKSDALKWITSYLENKIAEFDLIVFYDPPYEDVQGYESVYKLVSESDTPVKLILEGCQQKTMKLEKFLEKFPGEEKTFKQGTSFFVIYDFK